MSGATPCPPTTGWEPLVRDSGSSPPVLGIYKVAPVMGLHGVDEDIGGGAGAGEANRRWDAGMAIKTKVMWR